MTYSLYAFYDLKAKVYRAVFPSVSEPQALRIARTLAADKESDFGKWPEDFVVTKLGTWDDESGEFANQQPQRIAGLDRVIAT